MKVCNCYHPKNIINPYTGERQVVSCGKCNACRNLKAKHWVTRCDLESACHRYCWFVNLSYDDYNVPQIVRLRQEDSNHITYIDPSTAELFDSFDIHEQFEPKDVQYCYDTKVLDILYPRDFQLFIKRLRYYFRQVDKNAQLRYYITGEYGPRTYRCHAHCLIWFDSELCNKQFEELLHKSWSFGNIYQPHPVEGSAAQYVSSYINSFASLPKIYLHKGIRPFSLKSSNPALGSMYPLLGKEQELISRGDTTFRRFNPKTRKFEDVPFWKSLEDRLYPRCQRFSSLTHDDRVSLYRKMAEDFGKYDFLTSRQIAKRLQWEYIDSRYPVIEDGKVVYKRGDSFFHRYFYEISHKYKYSYRFTHQEVCKPWYIKNLPFLPKDVVFSRPFTGIKDMTREFCFGSLVRFVRSTSRLIHQASMLNISIEDYITKIEIYYEKKSSLKLREDYVFQNEYFMTHPKWHWIYFDKSFYDKVTGSDLDSWSPQTLLTVCNLFKTPIPTKVIVDSRNQNIVVLDIPPLEHLDDYKSLKLLHDKIAHELTKQKNNNDYALLHKDRFGNVLRFQNS